MIPDTPQLDLRHNLGIKTIRFFRGRLQVCLGHIFEGLRLEHTVRPLVVVSWETHISLFRTFEDEFPFPRWDILVPRRVYFGLRCHLEYIDNPHVSEYLF